MSVDRDVLESLVGAVNPRGDSHTARERGDQMRRRRRVVTSLSACALLLFFVGVVALAVDDPSDNSQIEVLDDPPTAKAPALPNIIGWSAIGDVPLSPRFAAALHWAGDELLVWGGLDERGSGLRDGMAYRPSSGSWRRMSDPPKEVAGGSPTSVVIDGELMVVTGELHSDIVSAAAYDFRNDSWRTLATPPFQIREGTVTAWTGSEALFYGGVSGDSVPDQAGYAYSPTADRWRSVPNPPFGPRASESVVWNQGELFVIGGSAQKWSWERYNPQRDGAAFNPATDQWRMLPAHPRANPQRAHALIGGIVVFDDGCDSQCVSAAMFYPASERWEQTTSVQNLEGAGYQQAVRVPFYSELFEFGREGGSALSATRATRRTLPPLPVPLRTARVHSVTATEDRVFVYGVSGGESQLWQYLPDMERVASSLSAGLNRSDAPWADEMRRELERQSELAAEAAAGRR